MRSMQRAVLLVTVLVGGSIIGCRRAVVIVPQRDNSYTARDTLYGTHKGNNVRVTFRHDTTWRVDTVRRTDTLWRAGSRVDTVLFTRVDTLAPGNPFRRPTRDTVYRRDTLRLVVRDTVRRVDTVRISNPSPLRRVDTVRVVVRDTIRRVDTVRVSNPSPVQRVDTVVRRDTVRVGGQRMLFVPPGQYPPEGQCRVWIHNVPPGQQARAAACDALGAIPAGAFVLFGGEAWDLDYDWVARGGAPPQIVALRRRGGR
jgi:hypothetical protein